MGFRKFSPSHFIFCLSPAECICSDFVFLLFSDLFQAVMDMDWITSLLQQCQRCLYASGRLLKRFHRGVNPQIVLQFLRCKPSNWKLHGATYHAFWLGSFLSFDPGGSSQGSVGPCHRRGFGLLAIMQSAEFFFTPELNPQKWFPFIQKWHSHPPSPGVGMPFEVSKNIWSQGAGFAMGGGLINAGAGVVWFSYEMEIPDHNVGPTLKNGRINLVDSAFWSIQCNEEGLKIWEDGQDRMDLIICCDCEDQACA